MEVKFRRDLNRNYMIVEREEITGNEYPIRMLEQNGIPEFLPFQLRKMNGKQYFYYEITSKQTLSQVYETGNMKRRAMEQLLLGIRNGIEHAQQYLLSEDDLLLDPDFIYFNVETGRVFLCCIPFLKEKKASFLTLAEFVLKKLDHGDRKAVDLGYELFNQVSQEHFSIQESLQLLLQGKKESFEFDGPAQSLEWGTSKDENIPEEGLGEEALFEDDWEEESEREISGKRKSKREGLGFGKGKGSAENQRGGRETRQDKHGKKSNELGRTKQGTWSLWKKIVICAGLTVLLGGLFGSIVYFGKLDLTQTGGLAFLFLAVLWIGYSIVETRKEKKKKHWLDEEEPEEDEFMESLLADLYREEGVESSVETREESEEICGETRCLTGMEDGTSLRLSSVLKREYPDIVIDRERIIVGKKRDQVTVCLYQDCISRIHAKIEKKKDQYFITDLNSTNGTFVNGERLLPNEQREITLGDKVSLATLRYVVKE